jgi:hypothetical protein
MKFNNLEEAEKAIVNEMGDCRYCTGATCRFCEKALAHAHEIVAAIRDLVLDEAEAAIIPPPFYSSNPNVLDGDGVDPAVEALYYAVLSIRELKAVKS